MAAATIFTPKEIVKLSKKHSAGQFNPRDAALIAMAGLACFTAYDLSLIQVRDLVNERGGLVEDGCLDESFSPSGKARVFFLLRGTYLCEVLEQYIEWRLANELGGITPPIFGGLDPDSRFFLKDDGKPFDLNMKRRFEGDSATQPLKMQRQFQKYYLGEGGSLKSLNDSFILNLWGESCQYGTTQAIRNLMALTGMTAETLKAKCIRGHLSVQEALEGLYR